MIACTRGRLRNLATQMLEQAPAPPSVATAELRPDPGYIDVIDITVDSDGEQEPAASCLVRFDPPTQPVSLRPCRHKICERWLLEHVAYP